METKIAREIVGAIARPEALLTEPDALIRELQAVFRASADLTGVVFSGSRAGMLIVRVEQSLREAIFALRPELSGDAAAHALITFSIYGSYYAFERCAGMDEDAVTRAIAAINARIMERMPAREN